MKIAVLKIVKELRHLDALRDKRHPMFERNRFAKFLAYFMVVYYAAILLFVGVTLAPALDGSMASFHVLDSAVIFLLIIDFWCRFIFQQTPAQQAKPYYLLPIPRKLIVDLFLTRSALAIGNLFWGFMLVPFAYLTIHSFYGWTGVIGWLFGYWLLIVANALAYQFCRSLLTRNLAWIALPIVIHATLVGCFFWTDSDWMTRLCIDGIEQFIFWNPFVIGALLVVIAAIYMFTRRLQDTLVFAEVSRQEDTEVKRTAEMKFLNRFGIVGEYLKLEMRMRMRNRVVRMQFLIGVGFIVFFSICLSFFDVYDNAFMTGFICLYNYLVLGMMTLVTIMGYEGNYLDGLMSRRESIYDLLRAKYIFNVLMCLLPLLLMLPTIFTGKASLWMNLGYLFLVTGVVFPGFFQLAVYNSETLPMNSKLTGKSGNTVQQIISVVVLFVPLALVQLSTLLLGDIYGYVFLIGLGTIGILTHPWWLRNIYQRFMARRHRNMEGFRASKQNT